MFIRRELIVPGFLVVLAAAGWGLFGLCVWKHREPPEVSSQKQEQAVEDLRHDDFVEVPVSPKPPVSISRPGPENAPAVVIATGSVAPTEEEPPQVFAPEPEPIRGTDSPSLPSPNWKLRGGDLGLKTWTFQARRVGRRAFIQFQGTLEAQTPTGMVEREFVTDPADERGWMASSALPGARYVDFELGASIRQVLDFSVNWGHGGRVGWGVGPSYDFDRKTWDVRGKIRIPLR